MSALSITNPVRFFSQRDNPRDPFVTCNVTSIATVLFDYGERPKNPSRQLEDELYDWVIRNYGAAARTEHDVLRKLYQSYGYSGGFDTKATWERIKSWLLMGKPVVVAGVFAGLEHILVVIGFNENGFIVHDPYGDARLNYQKQAGNPPIDAWGGGLLYSYEQFEKWQCVSGDTWAHFISPKIVKTDSILITQDTILKRSVLDSSKLPTALKMGVKKGDRFNVNYTHKRHRGHIEFQLQNSLGGFTNWFVFAGHCTLQAKETVNNMQAFLKLIRECEGTDHEPNGYKTIFTHKLFHDFSDHPRQLECCGALCSDAAGAYQFLSTTWDELADRLKLQDFSPPNQDQAAVQLIIDRDADRLVQNGKLRDALVKCSWIWASLPPGRYGQPIKSFDECSAIFKKYGGREV